MQQLNRENQKNTNKSIYLSGMTDNKRIDYSLWKVTKKPKRLIIHNPPIKNADGS